MLTFELCLERYGLDSGVDLNHKRYFSRGDPPCGVEHLMGARLRTERHMILGKRQDAIVS